MSATELYESNDPKLWYDYLNKYDYAIKLISKNKKKNELIQLDTWLWNELPINVYNRYKIKPSDGYYLTKEELSNIMKWKLIRGKFRPLQSLVDSNDDNSVKSCTGKALNILCNKNNEINWKKAIKELTVLKGIGVATASIILAIFCPELCPFMSDEVIGTVYEEKIDYTQKIYNIIQEKMLSKLTDINEAKHTSLKVEMLGKALWVASILDN